MSVRCAIAAAAVACLAAPAWAGKGDDAWAACLWEKVPTSANNALGMPVPPRWQSPGPIEAAYALQMRLQAACRDQLVPAGKKSAPRFDARAVRAALNATKPATIGNDLIDPKAFVCARYFLNDTDMKNPAAYRWGYGDDRSQAQLGTMSLVFAAKGGGGVGLPDRGGLEKCSWVQSDGSLKDA